MTTRFRVSTFVALAASALILTGCSSSGTVGGGDKSSTSGGSSGGSSGGAPVAAGSDEGCTMAAKAIQDAMKFQGSTNPQSAMTGMNTATMAMRNAAAKTKNSDAKAAMLKLSDDFATILQDVQDGKNPNDATSKALDDAQKVTEACGGKG